MKLIGISILVLILCVNSFAQIADEAAENILNLYFQTINQDKLLKTNTYVTKGNIVQGQNEYHFASYKKRPMKYRLESEIDGNKVITVVNGDSGWTIDPINGTPDPSSMSAEVYVRSKQFAEYDGIFYDYKEKGSQIEFVNDDYVGFIKASVLNLTTPSGDIITAFFNRQTNVLIKKKTYTMTQGVTVDMELLFSDYRYVNEILLPFTAEVRVNQETVMTLNADAITFNVDIPDSMFVMPTNDSQE